MYRLKEDEFADLPHGTHADEEAERACEELVRLSQELGLYDLDPVRNDRL